VTAAPRTVLVTGGSAGIGRAVVERFVADGDRVWFTYLRGRDRARDLLRDLHARGADARAFPLSLGHRASHDALLAALPGPVDVLVNNAAVGTATATAHAGSDPGGLEEAFFRVNAVGPLWLYQSLLPGMLDRGYGKVVHVSSVGGGVTHFPGFHPADGMSKAALTHLARQSAAELAHAPVDVFAVCPGAVDTGMFRASTLDDLTDAERDALTHELPGRRLIRAEEVAETIVWLCSEAGRLLRGAVLDASLGLGGSPALLARAH